jgi:hypothetical protein
MKCKLVVLVIMLLFAEHSNAQKSFEKGNVLLNPGVGLGSAGFGRAYDNNIAVFFAADFGVHDYVSVGPYIGTRFFGDKRTGFSLGARANFHWWQLLDDKVNADLKQNQLDIYWNVYLGYNFVTNKNDNRYRSAGFGSTLGLRWYPKANNRFALFGEFGRSPISWSVLGLTIKVK